MSPSGQLLRTRGDLLRTGGLDPAFAAAPAPKWLGTALSPGVAGSAKAAGSPEEEKSARSCCANSGQPPAITESRLGRWETGPGRLPGLAGANGDSVLPAACHGNIGCAWQGLVELATSTGAHWSGAPEGSAPPVRELPGSSQAAVAAGASWSPAGAVLSSGLERGEAGPAEGEGPGEAEGSMPSADGPSGPGPELAASPPSAAALAGAEPAGTSSAGLGRDA